MSWLKEEYTENLVSIIIPTFNRAGLIGETIESVFRQDYRPVEIIIVDDGSTDNTSEIIRQCNLSAPERVTIHYFKQDRKGANAARNIGAINSKGQYLQFFDSDDLMYQGYISKRISILKDSTEVSFCVCNCDFYDIIDKINLPPARLDLKEHSLEGMLEAGLPVMTPSFIARRDVFSLIGEWDEELLGVHDTDYFSRIFLLKLKGLWIPDILYMVRIHNDNLAQKWSREICENIIGFYIRLSGKASKAGMMTSRLKRNISRRITALCISGLASGYVRTAWKYFWKGWAGLSPERKLLRGGYFVYLTLVKPFRKNAESRIKSI